MSNKTIDSSKIVISIRMGTTRDIDVSWAGTKEIEHTKAFSVQSEQWISGVWMDGPTANTTDSPKTKWADLVKVVSLGAVDNAATKIRVRVKPVADTYKDDNSDKNYYEGVWSDWSAAFSGWTKTSKPPIFMVEPDSTKKNKDDFKIVKSKLENGKLGATFSILKSRMQEFLTYLTSFEFKWSGWNGAAWEDLNADFSYIYYNNGDNHAWNDPNITGYVEGGTEVLISDEVKAVVRAETKTSDKVRFRSYITPDRDYMQYRFTVVPKTDNEFYFTPYQSSVTYDYVPKTFKFSKKDISIVYDKDEDQFELSWKTEDFDKFSPIINHVAGFTVQWQYLKPICTIWNNAGKGTYNPEGGKYEDGEQEDISAEANTIDPTGYIETTEDKVIQEVVPVTNPLASIKTSSSYNRDMAVTDTVNRYNFMTDDFAITDWRTASNQSTIPVEKTISVPIRKWKYNFQLPDGVRRNNPIRVRILIKGDGDQSWEPEWSSWFEYTNKVDEVSVDMAMVFKPQISSRKLNMRWTLGSKRTVLYTSSFSYQWYYMPKNDIHWHDDKSGTVEINMPIDGLTEVATIGAACKAYNKKQDKYGVDINAPNDTYSQEQLNTYLNNPNYYTNRSQTPGLYVWACEYEPPEEAAAVMCSVTPVPITDAYYIGKPLILKYTVTTPTLEIDRTSVDINVLDAEQRSLFAVWNNITTVDGVDYSDYISGYECKWQYLRLNNWWDSSGTVAYSKMNFGPSTSSEMSVQYQKPISTFDVPDYLDIDTVRLSIRPTPSNNSIFKGVWCDWINFPISPKDLIIDDVEEYIDFTPYGQTGRELAGIYSNASSLPADAWPYGTREEEKNILFEWSYLVTGVWSVQNPVSVRIDYPNDIFTVPEGAVYVRLRLRADVDNINWIGQWSDYKTYAVNTLPYKIGREDIDVDLLEGTRDTVFARWIATKIPDGRTVEDYIENFTIQWRYEFSNQLWTPESSDVASSNIPTDLVSTYTPSQAEARAVVFMIKPNPKHELDFHGEWSDQIPFNLPENNIPEIPDTPEVELLRDGYTIIVTTRFTDRRTFRIEFDAYNDTDKTSVQGAIVTADWPGGTATYQFTGVGGKQYKFRVRATNQHNEYKTPELGDYTADPDGYSGWSQLIATRPAPVQLSYAKGVQMTGGYGIEIGWYGSSLYGTQDEVISYIVERSQKIQYFDASSNVESSEFETTGQSWIFTGIEAGLWYFRIAVERRNSEIRSEWSNIVGCYVGKPPTAPTTWSNKTIAMVNEPLYLYWTHNSEDNSDETKAQIRLRINGVAQDIIQLENPEGNIEQRSHRISDEYTMNEAIIQWEVRTMGGYSEFSPWSTIRIIKIFTKPVVTASLLGADSSLWNEYVEEHADANGVYDYSIPGTSVLSGNTVTRFPIFVRVAASPYSQTPVSYAMTIVSNNSYESSDSSGRTIAILPGTTIYRKYYNTNAREFTAMIMPGDVTLENGMSYTLNVIAAMDSGLVAETSIRFGASFSVSTYNLNASIGYDRTKFIAYIKPYCLDDNDAPMTNVDLAVYRRAFDGSLIKIADHIPGNLSPVITDPHPSLDYARYRIVVTDKANGHVDFADLPPHPIHCKYIILQWDEQWSSYFEISELARSDRPWKGSMIVLPFNIDTTDSNTADVEMVEYIGRDHPVSYYGTQVGQKATWNTIIPITDRQTIYDLRRLARYMGNVYVREPSGTGYWAHVEVSFNLTHLETTVPVSLSITRVEGGI